MAAPPSNGILTCVHMKGGRLCMPSCDSKFDFASLPEQVYMCDNGKWQAYPDILNKMSWPDCSGNALIVIFKL